MSLLNKFEIIDEEESNRLLVTGFVRSGKTLLCVVLSYLLHEYNNLPVYANFDISFGEYLDPSRLTKFEKKIEKCIIILDESYGILDSHFSGTNRFNEAVDFFMFQSGKREVSVFLISQLGGRIDKDYRRLADFGIVAEKIEKDSEVIGFGYKIFCGLIPISNDQYDIVFDKVFAKQFFGTYKTKEVIPPLKYDESKINAQELIDMVNNFPSKKSFVTYCKSTRYKYIIGDKLITFYDLVKCGEIEKAIEQLTG